MGVLAFLLNCKEIFRKYKIFFKLTKKPQEACAMVVERRAFPSPFYLLSFRAGFQFASCNGYSLTDKRQFCNKLFSKEMKCDKNVVLSRWH